MTTCECGCGTTLKSYQKYFSSHKCKAKVWRGEAHATWRGGKINHTEGYVRIKLEGHPRTDAQGYVLEHLLIAEKALGRPIPLGAQVHHWDEVRNNNAPSNLVICENQAYHRLLHYRQKAYEACGNPNAKKCYICKRYDMSTIAPKGRTCSYYHRECLRQHQIAYLRSKDSKQEVAS